MKTAIVGTRGLFIEDFSEYIPEGTSEIVSGGAKGIDRCAAGYAKAHGYKLTELLPNYRRFGRGAPLKRNLEIVGYADHVLVFWDGRSRGSKSVIEACQKCGKKYQVFLFEHK